MRGQTTRVLPHTSILPLTAGVSPAGRLAIGGCDVAELAARFGTPLYVLDEETVRVMCRQFRDEFGSRYPDTAVIYASKAFLSPALAALVAEEGLGVDVVSGGELAIALAADFPADRIYFHGNNKSREELEAALRTGVGRVVVDNFSELELLDHLAGEAHRRPAVLLRVSPGVEAHTHEYTTTGTLDSKFGFPLVGGQADEAVRRALAAPNLELLGLHFHLGSPIFLTEPYVRAIEVTFTFAAEMRDRHGFQLREFSPGGGFAIHYVESEVPPPVATYAQAITHGLRSACDVHRLSPPRLVLEPGRAIVGRAGVALYTVGAIKEVPGPRRFVAVDGGMGDNIRPALYGAEYVALAASHPWGAEETVTIVGRYCESGDILIRDARLPHLEAGDLLAVPAAGAYCLAMSNNYNANPRPAVVLVHQGRPRLIRRRETVEDLLRCEVWPGE